MINASDFNAFCFFPGICLFTFILLILSVQRWCCSRSRTRRLTSRRGSSSRPETTKPSKNKRRTTFGMIFLVFLSSFLSIFNSISLAFLFNILFPFFLSTKKDSTRNQTRPETTKSFKNKRRTIFSLFCSLSLFSISFKPYFSCHS